MEERHYRINIEPRILELLGPNLYTNIYYILGELIANAYDADAHNVYIIEKDNSIIVEDDGKGMSYKDGETDNFLNVAKESRTSENDALTDLNRRKMGRKGVGKLACLSVSENVHIKTIKNGEKSGFILSRNAVGKDLEAISEENITFEKVREHGTSIEMLDPVYNLPKMVNTAKNNITRVFPFTDKDFVIHIKLKNGPETEISESQSVLIDKLGALITYGDEFSNLQDSFNKELIKKNSKLSKKEQEIVLPIVIKDKNNIDRSMDLTIKGWIGVNKSTANTKIELKSFSDNFLAIYANKKLGEFNILPFVGKNKLNEVYIVGQLHIDEFENSDFPDMALSNRQGYKDDDPRYIAVMNYVREKMLPEILSLRGIYSQVVKEQKEIKKKKKKKEDEEKLKQNVELFERKVSESLLKKIDQQSNINAASLDKIVSDVIQKNIKRLQLNTKVDSQKRKVLISHTGKDKVLADVVYDMLLFNGFEKSEIIYTNSDDIEARIPTNSDIFEYLRDFFVDSISNQKIYVIYVTSQNMDAKWAVLSEIGAGWITKSDYYILTLNSFFPKAPLDSTHQFQNTLVDEENLYTTKLNIQLLCNMVEKICENFEYTPKERKKNIVKIQSYISELSNTEYDKKQIEVTQGLSDKKKILISEIIENDEFSGIVYDLLLKSKM